MKKKIHEEGEKSCKFLNSQTKINGNGIVFFFLVAFKVLLAV